MLTCNLTKNIFYVMNQLIKTNRSVIHDRDSLYEYRKDKSALKADYIIYQTQIKSVNSQSTCFKWYKKFDLGNF